MKLHIYKVEKVEDFKNTATSISHDYTADFEEYRKARGYIKTDYHITDTPDLNDGNVYCCGNFLIKAIEHIGTFENEPIGLKFDHKK